MAADQDDNAWYIIAYVIPIVTGIVVLFLKGGKNNRLKLHSMQSILLGILWIVVAIIFNIISIIIFFFWIISTLLLLFIWLYGLYVGFKAYEGIDIVIPTITEYAKRYSNYKEGKRSKSKK